MQKSFITVCAALFFAAVSGQTSLIGKRGRSRFESSTIKGMVDFRVIAQQMPLIFPAPVEKAPNSTPMDVQITIDGLIPGFRYRYYIAPTPIAQDDGRCASVTNYLLPDSSRIPQAPNVISYRCDPNDVVGTCAYGDLSGINGLASVNLRGETFKKTFRLDYLQYGTGQSGNFDIIGKAFVVRGVLGDSVACGNIYVLNKCPS
ncbi:hypothetical protein BB561_001305 [Smittium simulii]|uniref:Superoxide dismutase copper/zinc binding domain-containing protein n=1 Tax=Smittium simulii TaxID=133385 RepID=A0A2T9YV67_9FUNG|nr:hypothetical protein BB561_001305 [Smittium simulii]